LSGIGHDGRGTRGEFAIRCSRCLASPPALLAPMILEVACLNVVPGREAEFEDAFRLAQRLIASMSGYRSHQLHRSIESTHRYLLLVNWDRLEDHTQGFRGSREYQEWKRLLHHFYEPFPVVEHYGAVAGVPDKPVT